MPKQRHPRARAGLVISELPGAVMVYNFADHSAHCVATLGHQVMLRCDAGIAPKRIASARRAGGQPVEDAQVEDAIAQLARAAPAAAEDRGTAALSVATPMIRSIVAPTAAQAASLPVSCIPPNACIPDVLEGACCGTMNPAAGSCTGNVCGTATGACVGRTCG